MRGSPAHPYLAATLLALGCPTTAPVARDATITGTWGGDHAALVLDDRGGAIEYDCAHGTIAAPVRPDAAGGFTVGGFHTREHGGPVRVGEVPDSAPAVYTGRVAGDAMTLRVLVGRDSLGPFALRRGEAGRVFKCL